MGNDELSVLKGEQPEIELSCGIAGSTAAQILI
jgi:hypothetical protein